ncbi:PAS domain-containing protein [Streptomyces sp. NPDC054794]
MRSTWRAELRGDGARRPLARAHPRSSEQQRVYSCSYFRLQDDTGRPLGVCEAAVEITERYEAQTRLALLSRASGIGTTLDVRRTMEEFARLMVPDFADSVRIEVAESVLAGEEVAPLAPRAPAGLRLMAERTRSDRPVMQGDMMLGDNVVADEVYRVRAGPLQHAQAGETGRPSTSFLPPSEPEQQKRR